MIPFYVVPGDCLILLGYEIVHKCTRFGPENPPFFPPDVKDILKKNPWIALYSMNIYETHKDAVRTYLMVVPSKLDLFKSYFVWTKALTSRNLTKE